MEKKYPRKTKYKGLREVALGNFEASFYPFKGAKKKEYHRVKAETAKQASDMRLDMMVEKRRANQIPEEQRNILSADFHKARQDLLDGLFNKQGEPLPKKTKQKYEKTFKRMFIDFRALKYPNLNSPIQLSPRLGLRFIEEYRNYFCGGKLNEVDEYHLSRHKGWRSEIIMVKAILRRLYKLGYVSADLVLLIREEVPRPKPNKTPYIELLDSQMIQILDGIKKKRPDFWDLARFQCGTGRRVEESTLIEKADVRWQGIKLDKLSIRSETTKMKEDAPIWILVDLEEIVRHAYANSNKHKVSYLFLNLQNRKINQRDYNDCLRETSREITGVGITTKYFRKRFMTECQKRGVPLEDAMAVCGLKDKEVALQYYSYPTKEGQQKALEAMSLK